MKKTLLLLLAVLTLAACSQRPAPEEIDSQSRPVQPITGGEFVSAEGNEVTIRVWMGAEPCDVFHGFVVTETATGVDIAATRFTPDPTLICPAIALERLITAQLDAPLGDRDLTISGIEIVR